MTRLLGSALSAFVMAATIARVEAAEPGLTGEGRNNFVESGFQTCFQKQTTDPVNKGIEVAVLAQFCVCYVDRMADQIANDDLAAMDSQVAGPDRSALEAKMQPIAKLAREVCIAKLRK